MLCGRTRTLRDAVKLITMIDVPDVPGLNMETKPTGTSSEGFFMEEKMDGERIQLHKRGNEFYYCSR